MPNLGHESKLCKMDGLVVEFRLLMPYRHDPSISRFWVRVV